MMTPLHVNQKRILFVNYSQEELINLKVLFELSDWEVHIAEVGGNSDTKYTAPTENISTAKGRFYKVGKPNDIGVVLVHTNPLAVCAKNICGRLDDKGLKTLTRVFFNHKVKVVVLTDLLSTFTHDEVECVKERALQIQLAKDKFYQVRVKDVMEHLMED